MDRVIIGKTPDTEASFPASNRRAGKTGLFISKPGANVMFCSDGDLLFDSTAPDFMQVLAKGTDSISRGTVLNNNIIKPTIKTIETNIKVPYVEENATVLVRWTALTPASNVHQIAFSSSWGTPGSESYVTIPPYLNIDNLNLSNPANTGITLGYSLTARTLKRPAKILPQTPVSLSTVGTDGRAEPEVDNHRGSVWSTYNILWSNTSHIFITDSEGAPNITIVGPADSIINNHSPSWKAQAGWTMANIPIAWSGAVSASPDDIFIYSRDGGDGTITKRSTNHTYLYPSFTKSIGGTHGIRFVKSGYNQTIVDSLGASVEDNAIMSHRPNQLTFSTDYTNLENNIAVLYRAGADETISDIRVGPQTGGTAVEGGDAWREYAIVFVVKGIADDSLGRIMIIDDTTAPNAFSPLGIVPRQVSPSYMNCSSPAWSPRILPVSGPGPAGSKLLFIADAGTPERRVCIVDSGTYWGTNDNALPNGPIHNPYSLVELTETKANTATWANNTHILSDYNGGSYTDVSTLTAASDTVDIVFSNGSPYKDHFVAWTLYRTKGV